MTDELIEQGSLEESLIRRVRIASLNAETAIAVARGNTLPEILHACAVALARHLDLAMAMIGYWIPTHKFWNFKQLPAGTRIPAIRRITFHGGSWKLGASQSRVARR